MDVWFVTQILLYKNYSCSCDWKWMCVCFLTPIQIWNAFLRWNFLLYIITGIANNSDKCKVRFTFVIIFKSWPKKLSYISERRNLHWLWRRNTAGRFFFPFFTRESTWAALLFAFQFTRAHLKWGLSKWEQFNPRENEGKNFLTDLLPLKCIHSP